VCNCKARASALSIAARIVLAWKKAQVSEASMVSRTTSVSALRTAISVKASTAAMMAMTMPMRLLVGLWCSISISCSMVVNLSQARFDIAAVDGNDSGRGLPCQSKEHECRGDILGGDFPVQQIAAHVVGLRHAAGFGARGD